MLYPILRKLLFTLEPETAHRVTLTSLNLAYRLQLLRLLRKPAAQPCQLMGLTFPNRIGMAAGFDKNGEYIDAIAALGFGFVEVGTVTPKPQIGNPKPRLFRLPEYQAVINRLGFNNKGVDYLVSRLQKTRYQGILGVNLGKNKDTPLEKALDDYLYGFRKVWPYASYITINISSPNTPQLRILQEEAWLSPLLQALKEEQSNIAATQKKYVPLVVKISPDVSKEELQNMAQIFLEKKIDGIIATNTTIGRTGVENHRYANEAGGLSGRPLYPLATHIVRELKTLIQNRLPIIGVGGIMDAACGQEKLAAGADLLQVYTGLIYAGPSLVNELVSFSAL